MTRQTVASPNVSPRGLGPPWATGALSLALLAAWAGTAAGQLNVLSPLFRDLNGGAVWGSMGQAVRSQAATQDERPIWRAGFAAFYGPFGGGGDTSVVRVYVAADSTDSMFTLPNGTVVRRHSTTTTTSRSESRHIGRGGKVMLAVGYQHSAFYRVPGTPLPSTVALGGAYLGAFLGPYPSLLAKRLQWYTGVGGTIVQMKDLAGRVDTVAVSLTTERTFAPEFYVMLSYNVSSNYRVLVAGSYQYLRFGSVAYRPVEPARVLPAAALDALPDEIRLESWHVTLGVSFAASSLIPAR
jgi:hypothetical protein